jgi:hypothetical protein
MADLNPNRAGNTLALADGGGAIALVDGSSTFTVAQLGNVITVQLGDTVAAAVAADTDTCIIDTVITADAESVNDAQRLIARMLPTGSPLTTLSVMATALVSNTATAGGAATITLAGADAEIDTFYDGWTVEILSGTGAGQTRTITSYVNVGNVATVGVAWATQPDNTSVYLLTGPSGTVWVVTQAVVSTNLSKLRLTITPSNGAWELVDGVLPTLDIEGAQLRFMSAAQDGRDFVSA